MDEVDQATQCRVAYEAHVERLISTMPAHHHDMLRSVLRHPTLADQIARVLALKSQQTIADGAYHNAIFGGPALGIAEKFTIFEVGCTPSVLRFAQYWRHLRYDSYRDYVTGILYNEGKGLTLFAKMTGEAVPEGMSAEFVDRFIVGHVLREIERNIIFLALLWKLPDGRMATFSPELLGSLIISREDIEERRCEKLLYQIMARADMVGGLSALQGRIVFSVAGYNEDRRELFDIPEVKAYFTKLDSIVPYFLFFIAGEEEENGECTRLFLKMFIEPNFFSSPQPTLAMREQFNTFILTRLNCVADYCVQNSKKGQPAIDPVTTVHHAFRCCGYMIGRGEAQAMLDAR